MLLGTICAPCVTERPLCVMARGVLERLLDSERLEALVDRTAEPQCPRECLCSSVVQWMRAVVRGVHPSVQAAEQSHKETIGVSTTALDHTLERGETGGAAALVRDSARLAEPVGKLSCASQTLGAPTAAWLAWCLAWLASHAVSVLPAARRRAPGRPPVTEAVAGDSLSLAIRRTYDGLMIAMPAPPWAGFPELSPVACAHVLRQLASAAKLSRDQNILAVRKRHRLSEQRTRLAALYRPPSASHHGDHSARAAPEGCGPSRSDRDA